MNNIFSIGLISILLIGCSPEQRVDRKSSETFDELEKVLEECGQLVQNGRGDMLEALNKRDPWDTQINVYVASRSTEKILLAVSAGADCTYHTADDIILTRKLPPNTKAAEQGVSPNGQ